MPYKSCYDCNGHKIHLLFLPVTPVTGHRTRAAEGMRRLIANQIREEWASTDERTRQRMVQMRAKRVAKLADARLRASRLCSAA
uniref:Uncharacterized protein n=1 Tax=Onchocerca volvulus TaxID=6282 RepID=A0A8R1TSA9_ONCVO